jgi:spore coat polysaccharide biosynthesis protein SpsF
MKFGIFITVRTGSTRLPNKALLEINGKTTIEHLIDRIKLIKKSRMIVLCTTRKPNDDVLENIAIKNNIECFRGSEDDKLARWEGAVNKYSVDFFVTVDGDDLFCDPDLIDLAISQMEADSCDMIKTPEDLICGAFTYCISAPALHRVCEIKASENTEMMWGYFTETGLFKVRDLQVEDQIFHNKRIRMTLDYPEDLIFFKRIFTETKGQASSLPLRDILNLINNQPEIAEINYFRQKQFLQNQREKTNILLKNVQHHEH